MTLQSISLCTEIISVCYNKKKGYFFSFLTLSNLAFTVTLKMKSKEVILDLKVHYIFGGGYQKVKQNSIPNLRNKCFILTRDQLPPIQFMQFSLCKVSGLIMFGFWHFKNNILSVIESKFKFSFF